MDRGNMSTQQKHRLFPLQSPMERAGKCYYYDANNDAFYERDKASGNALKPVLQKDMPVCYYIIEPATLCVFGSGRFTSGLGHFTRESNGYPTFAWEPTREWNFYKALVVFSPHIDMDWIHLKDEAMYLPSDQFTEFLHDEPPKNNLPSLDEIMRRIRPQGNATPTPPPVSARSTPARNVAKASRKPALAAVKEKGYPGYELKYSNANIYAAGQHSDEELVDLLTETYRGLPRSGQSRLFIVEVGSASKRNLKQIRKELQRRCPRMTLAFRGDVCRLSEEPPSFDSDADIPKLCWQDPSDRTCYATYECYEGYSHDGSVDYYSVYTKKCSQSEYDRMKRKRRKP